MKLACLKDGEPIGGVSTKSSGNSIAEHCYAVGIVKSKHSSN